MMWSRAQAMACRALSGMGGCKLRSSQVLVKGASDFFIRRYGHEAAGLGPQKGVRTQWGKVVGLGFACAGGLGLGATVHSRELAKDGDSSFKGAAQEVGGGGLGVTSGLARSAIFYCELCAHRGPRHPHRIRSRELTRHSWSRSLFLSPSLSLRVRFAHLHPVQAHGVVVQRSALR